MRHNITHRLPNLTRAELARVTTLYQQLSEQAQDQDRSTYHRLYCACIGEALRRQHTDTMQIRRPKP